MKRADTQALRVLHVEDSEDDAHLVRLELSRGGYIPEIVRVETPDEMESALRDHEFDVIVSDFAMPAFSGTEALAMLKRSGIDLPFVIVSGTIGEETAVAAMKAGAHDYIMKGNLRRLVPAIQREIAERNSRAERRRAEAELNASRHFAASIADASPNLLYMFDLPTGKMTYINDAVVHMLGYSRTIAESMSREVIYKIIHPDDLAAVATSAAELGTAADNTVVEVEFRVSSRANGWRLLHNRATVFSRTPEGAPLLVLGTAQDITDRKYYESQLLESRELLQHVVSANPAVTYLLQVDGNRTPLSWISDNIGRFAGYSSIEALEPYWWTDNVHPEDREEVRSLRSMLLSLESQTIEYRFRHKNGNFIWILDNVLVIRNSDGNPIEVVGTWTDITQRKSDEERIRQLDTLVDLSGEAFLVRDLSHRILSWNKGAERLYGWTEAEAVGKSSTDLFGIPLEAEQTMLDYLLRLGEWSGESVHTVKGGANITVLSRLTLIRSKSGQPMSVLSVITDISEIKRIQAQFLRAQRMENLGTLAGGIAHDLNNILSPIVMAINILSQKIHDPDSRRIFQALESSATRGVEMVKQILTFARGVEGERIPLQPRYLIEEILKISAETFPRSIVFKKIIPRDLWTVVGDATQIHQVLLNLCVNARDAMTQGGMLTVTAANTYVSEDEAKVFGDLKPGPYVKLVVADSGTGISKAVLAKIFDPFFTTKGSGKGTGLGLSTVSAIVKSHHGAIHVESEIDAGTQFIVFFPASTGVHAGKKHDDPLEALRGDGQLILVVDDEKSIREIAQMTLELYGYRTMTANDGIEALSLYARESLNVNAVLMDMNMPFLDGNGTIRGLRKMNPEIKIIPCSGSMTVMEDAQPVEGSLEIRLVKPFTAEKLLQALHQVFHQEVRG